MGLAAVIRSVIEPNDVLKGNVFTPGDMRAARQTVLVRRSMERGCDQRLSKVAAGS